MVRKMEACGSSSGRTRQPVVIADCGELPTRRQVLAKLAAEKQMLADMKKDVVQVRSIGWYQCQLLCPMDFVLTRCTCQWQDAPQNVPTRHSV